MRYITPYIPDDLRSKMVFISGPRQMGKTTLAKNILSGHFPSGRYLDWGLDEDRQDILKKRWDMTDRLLIFDELHKFPIKENRLEELIEVKWSDEEISKSLLYDAERLKPERATQITAHLRRTYSQGRIRVIDPLSYFRPGFFDPR